MHIEIDTVELTLFLHHETERGIKVSLAGDEKNACWLPKSRVEYTGPNTQGIIEAVVPEWLAHNEGLI